VAAAVDGLNAAPLVDRADAADGIERGEREVTYWIGRSYWGKGIATGALKAFLAVDQSRPLHARVAYDNVASHRVLEKCGFASSRLNEASLKRVPTKSRNSCCGSRSPVPPLEVTRRLTFLKNPSGSQDLAF
jgi:Acetyltransferase (GNAT) domain